MKRTAIVHGVEYQGEIMGSIKKGGCRTMVTALLSPTPLLVPAWVGQRHLAWLMSKGR
jgi:hypothetical protein